MIEETGNIWDYWKCGSYIVIPTNGKTNANGEAVMGRGIAKVFSSMYPNFPALLGKHLKENGNHVEMFLNYHVFSFPVKDHWHDKADLKLIQRSANELRDRLSNLGASISVVLPEVGSGNGRLDWKSVAPIINMEMEGLTNIVLVHPSENFYD